MEIECIPGCMGSSDHRRKPMRGRGPSRRGRPRPRDRGPQNLSPHPPAPSTGKEPGKLRGRIVAHKAHRFFFTFFFSLFRFTFFSLFVMQNTQTCENIVKLGLGTVVGSIDVSRVEVAGTEMATLYIAPKK